MVGSKDLPPSTQGFPSVFWNNQFRAKTEWPAAGTTLAGRTAIVTGSNTGLGYESARQLLDLHLSQLIIAVRSAEKGEAAARKLRERAPKAKIQVWELDMASYESIQAFAKRVESDLPRVDCVLLNAGVSNLSFRTVASTGNEEMIQVNYLSTMLLTLLLLPILKQKCAAQSSDPPHLTIVSAALTLIAKFPNRNSKPVLPSFNNEKNFARDVYPTSKLLAHMFLWKLVDYVSADDVIVNLADCAWVRGTELHRDTSGILWCFMKLFELLGRTPDVGASCFVDALVNKGKESHGCFLMSWKVHPFAAMLYGPEGEKLTEKVWEETLSELSFANPTAILEDMKH